MSSPEAAGSSKRRKLNTDGIVKPERGVNDEAEMIPSTSASSIRAPPSSEPPSQPFTSKSRARSASQVDNAQDGASGDDEDASAVKRPKKEKRVVDEVAMDEVRSEQGVHEEDDDDDVLDDGDGLMADLSEEARERLAMRDADGYLPGAIVRVQLKSFLTYDFAEFYPGPYLNMIIGPNGSGKSTVVNAIAIGLGWSPKILGRGDDLSQFLKYGANEAYVEIELKGLAGKRNLVVKRTLGKDSNKSKMEMNGKHATMKTVRAAVEALNIQVGNLCSFLPQDKVSEFACMSPQELLQQTQKAAGPPQMTQWHQMLITAGSKFKELNENLQRRQEDLDSKARAAARLEGEVRNAKDREKLVEEITYLDHLIPFAAYTKARESYNTLRAERKLAHNDFKAAQQAMEPFDALKEEFRQLGKDVQTKLSKAQTNLQKLETNMKLTKRNIVTHDDNIQSCMQGITSQKQKAEQRKVKLREAKDTAAKAQQKFDARAEPEPLGDLEHISANARRAQREIDDRISSEIHSKRQPIDGNAREKEGRIKQLKTHIDNLSQVSNARMNNLRNWPKSQDVVQLVEFLRQDAANVANGGQSYFKMQVFEPPCLSVDVPNRAYAAAVEASINAAQLRTIICQCQEDYNKVAAFSDSTNNPIGKKLEMLNVTLVTPGAPREQPPIHRDQLRELGFEGYAIDFVRAPDPIMTFLEVHAGFHRTAISLNQMGRGGLDWQRINSSSLTAYVASDTSFQTATSRYGAKTKSSQTTAVRPAKSFSASVDQSQIERANNEIQELIKEIETARRTIRDLETQEAALMHEKQQHADAMADAQRQMKIIKDHQKHNAMLEQNLNEARSKYERLKNQPTDEERREQLMAELSSVVKDKIKEDMKFAKSCLQLSKIQQAVVDFNLEVLQVQANVAALAELAQEAEQTTADAKEYFDQVEDKFKRQKEKTSKALNKAQTKLDELDEEAREAFQARRETDGAENEGLDALEETRAMKQAELETIGGADPTVIAKYDKVQNEIRILTDEVQDLEHEEKRLTKKIDEVKGKWLPELKKLVENFNKKFSAAMDSLDDRGEIRIREHEDYAQWAIEIMVSFRAEDKLHLLTSTHQSGGERSLATIMYLMSMIELSNAPFSLVDEINQGMDPRAERAVHNQMVKVTCHKEAGQFFLLTPKLLQQLDYHERMRVLVVCNGEWLPERAKNDTKGKLFLRKILDDVKRKNSTIAV